MSDIIKFNKICRQATIDLNQALNYLENSNKKGFVENITNVTHDLGHMLYVLEHEKWNDAVKSATKDSEIK